LQYNFADIHEMNLEKRITILSVPTSGEDINRQSDLNKGIVQIGEEILFPDLAERVYYSKELSNRREREEALRNCAIAAAGNILYVPLSRLGDVNLMINPIAAGRATTTLTSSWLFGRYYAHSMEGSNTRGGRIIEGAAVTAAAFFRDFTMLRNNRQPGSIIPDMFPELMPQILESMGKPDDTVSITTDEVMINKVAVEGVFKTHIRYLTITAGNILAANGNISEMKSMLVERPMLIADISSK
jgi:hypothetical protein